MEEVKKSFLRLIKLDANNLFKRIGDRKESYLHIFSLKRSRDHYAEVFKNKYNDTPLSDLKMIKDETISVLDEFFTKANNLKWYLEFTEDMPTQIEDHLSYEIASLGRLIDSVNLHLDLEMGLDILPEEIDDEEVIEHFDAGEEPPALIDKLD